jgi:hypothetical protein
LFFGNYSCRQKGLTKLNPGRYVVFACCFVTIAAFSQSPVRITVDSNVPGTSIPADFVGESFETRSLSPNNRGVKGYFFDSTNTQLLNLFKDLGIKNLRIGGATVDHSKIVPTLADIDALFRFAKSSGVKVIYTLRLTNGDAPKNGSIARYIWTNYRPLLDCFAIGNEPDWHSYHIEDPEIFETTPGIPGTAYRSYLAKWRRFAAIVLDSVPEAKFSGPNSGSNFPVVGAKNTGYNGKSWTANFVDDEKNSGFITFFTQHNYVGQSTNGKTIPEIVDGMLSPTWDSENYPALYTESCAPVISAGFPFRLTESNSFSEGIDGGSNTFATALFALDYLHWWAAHNAAGINFHSTQWRYNATFHLDSSGHAQVYPMAYGIKAFSLGGLGTVQNVTVSNPDTLNLTAYAIMDTSYLYVTIVNKEHGTAARTAEVEIAANNLSDSAVAMFLTGPNGDVFATTGVTLGGGRIDNDKAWEGEWKLISMTSTGHYKMNVPAASAAIIKIRIGARHNQLPGR